jgi:hypothetical protein
VQNLKKIQVYKQNEQKNLKNLKKLHGLRLFWKSSSRNALCWELYYVTSNKQVDLTPAQVMHCIFCYNYPDLNLNLKTQEKKIIYNTTHDIIVLKKHVNVNHSIIIF